MEKELKNEGVSGQEHHEGVNVNERVREINKLLHETEEEYFRLSDESQEKWPKGHLYGGEEWKKNSQDQSALLEKM